MYAHFDPLKCCYWSGVILERTNFTANGKCTVFEYIYSGPLERVESELGCV